MDVSISCISTSQMSVKNMVMETDIATSVGNSGRYKMKLKL